MKINLLIFITALYLIGINCSQNTPKGFTLIGDSTSKHGAAWTYQDTSNGIVYDLEGVLYKPNGLGPFPAVVLSHGLGGNAASYCGLLAEEMRSWGLVCIATNYTHAGGVRIGEPGSASEMGASEANILRAHTCLDILSRLGYVDMKRIAAHGHSMGAFVTAALVGSYPNEFLAASHTAGGVFNVKLSGTKFSQANGIRAPYQIHHGDADFIVPLEDDLRLDSLLNLNKVEHEFYVYQGYEHNQVLCDPTMFRRVKEWYTRHGLFDSASTGEVDESIRQSTGR